MIHKRYRDISKNSIFFWWYDTIRYIDIENDISIFSIYRIITVLYLCFCVYLQMCFGYGTRFWLIKIDLTSWFMFAVQCWCKLFMVFVTGILLHVYWLLMALVLLAIVTYFAIVWSFCLSLLIQWYHSLSPYKMRLPFPFGSLSVSYTHLTLPTNREV